MICAAGSTPAAAQSLFEQLFGSASPPRPTLQSAPHRLGTVGVARPSAAPLTGTQATAGDDDDDANARLRMRRGHDQRDDGKTFQTMCVRTCDGYFWPASYPVSRSEFQREANVCQASCGAQTRLFYRPGPGTDPEEMRDVEGRSYGATPNAFAYRKGLIDGCACKPMPWSDGERARHEGYALIEAEKRLRAEQAEAERVAAIQAAAEALAARVASLEPKPELLVRSEAFVSPEGNAAAGALAFLAAVPILMPEVAGPSVVAEVAGAGIAASEVAVRKRPEIRARREIAATVPVARDRRTVGLTARQANQVQMVVSQPKPAAALFGLGAGGGKYSYPGDR